jgi:tRNA A22 N-methylase
MHRWQPSVAPPNIFPTDQGDIFSAANNLARALREWLMNLGWETKRTAIFQQLYIYIWLHLEREDRAEEFGNPFL